MSLHSPKKMTDIEKQITKIGAAARYPDGEGESRPGGQRMAAWVTRPDGSRRRGRDLGTAVERAAIARAMLAELA